MYLDNMSHITAKPAVLIEALTLAIVKSGTAKLRRALQI